MDANGLSRPLIIWKRLSGHARQRFIYYKMRFIPHVLLALLLFSCGDDGFPVTLEKNQVIRLLTQNNNKAWTLSTTVACEEDDILTFHKAADAKTAAEFIYSKGEIYCQDQAAEDSTGTWEVISAPGTNQLRIHGEATVTYDIELITATTLHLRTAELELIYQAR